MSSSSQIDTEFSGPSVTTTYPPHNGLAVGPNNIVMVEGSRIEWTNLAGGSPTLQSTYDFFSSLSPTGGLYDQRCVYDPINQRYIVIMEYGASGGISAIDIAVSKDSNPNDGWYFASLNTSLTINGQLTASDRPMLSVDGTNLYITASQGSAGTECWVIGDTAGAGGGIYNGGTLTVTANELVPSSQGVFSVVAGNNGKTYYASSYSNGSQIVVALQIYDVATSTFGPISTIGLGKIDQGGSYTAQQLGTSLLLDAGDKRIQNLAYANGFLYGVTEEKPIGSSVPLVHWFKIDISNPNSPTLVAQGDISGASLGSNVATFNASIAVDGAGDVIINFTASGPNMYPGDYYVFHGANDPVGSFSAPILYQASTGFFDSGNGSSVQRWGINSSATVGPNNPNSFWISNEYVATGWWQTSVAQIEVKSSSSTTVGSIVTSGLGISGGTGDLNAGKVVTLTVNFSSAVTIDTTAGTPMLTLNDGGSATYSGGSGTSAIAFSYTVASGQNTSDLTVSALNLNGATIRDGVGNAADLSGATNYNPAGVLQIDTAAPAAPTGLGLDTATDSGAKGDGITNVSQAKIDGTAEAGSTVTLYDTDRTTVLGTGTANATTGAFSITTSALSDGTHSISAKATDAAGNTGAASTAYAVRVDTAAPAAPTGLSLDATTDSGTLGDGITNVTQVKIDGIAEPGSTVTLYDTNGTTVLGTGTANATTGAFSITTSALSDGTHSISAKATDAAGNTGVASTAYAVRMDTAAPAAPTGLSLDATTDSGTQGDGITSFTQVKIDGTAEAGSIVTLYDTNGTTVLGTGPANATTGAFGITTSTLASGTHNITAKAIDAAGNASTLSALYAVTVTAASSTSEIETQFSGISVTSTYPPQNGLAVGPNNIVMAEGSRIEWTNLAGGSPAMQSVYNFFSPLGATATSSLNHPRCVYDSINQRYIVVMDNSASGHTISNIDIAVSRDSNPNDGWYFASLNTSLTINNQLTSSDRPMVSVDGTNIYITASQYNVNVSGYAGTECWVIGDTAGPGGGIYSGGTLTVTANQLTPSNQSIFTVVAGSGKTYYASSYSNGNQIVVALQIYDVATSTFGPVSAIGLGKIDQGGSYTAQQLGTSLLLDAGDKRIQNLIYANGFLYGVTEEKPIGSSVPLVHWFKIDVSNPNSPTLAAQGDISGASLGSNVATFNGSIAVDAGGDVLINFTASGPNMYPGDYYVYQRGSDPPGSFSAPALYQASTGFFNSGNGAGVQPWGNYSSATVDPNNPNSFWISNEYVANNWWQTSVAKVAIDTAETPTLTITNASLNVTAGGSVPLGITATPVDSDDTISVKISGVPTYETVTAPGGNTVTSSLQADGTNTWTVTEGASTKGTPLTALTLSSSYTGSDHPIATFTVTASNTTSGETATSAAQTMTVIDPPAVTAGGGPSASPRGGTVASTPNLGQIDRLVALMDQFTAAGFHEDQTGLGAITSMFGSNGSHEDLAFLATPHHHHA